MISGEILQAWSRPGAQSPLPLFTQNASYSGYMPPASPQRSSRLSKAPLQRFSYTRADADDCPMLLWLPGWLTTVQLITIGT